MRQWAMLGASASEWRLGPARPELSDGELHVWRAQLEARAAGLEPMLSADERSRARRFHFERDRHHWVAAHALVRLVLGRYLRVAPEDLVLATGPHDKPELGAAAGASWLRFNLSHSGGLALLAAVHSIEVGIDVELVRDDRDLLGVARRVLAADVVAALERLRPGERAAVFYPAWARQEARGKCLGMGLKETEGEAVDPDVHVIDLDVGVGYAAALAAWSPPDRVRLWDFLW